MTDAQLLHLAQELEWLGCELEFYGHKHAMESFPCGGPTWDTFLEKRRGVLTTADKIERELKSTVTYNPTSLVGVDFPLEATLDSVTGLLNAVEDIKQTAVVAVHDLPSKVREFTRMVQDALGAARGMIQ